MICQDFRVYFNKQMISSKINQIPGIINYFIFGLQLKYCQVKNRNVINLKCKYYKSTNFCYFKQKINY